MNYLYLLLGWVKGEIFDIPGRSIAFIFFIFLICFPVFTQEPYYLRIVTMTLIFALFAVSWDVLSGVTGQLNLGHALFFGVAAYAAAFLNVNLGLSAWLTIPLGALVSVVVGLFAALPALRLRGFYLGLVTLSLPIILTGFIFIFPDITGGEMGISGVSRLSRDRVSAYYIVLIIFSFSVFFMWKFTDASSKIVRTGIVLHAIREDEIAARSSGINTVYYKMIAFAVSGFFAGIAGGLYVHYLRVAGPSTLELFFSFQVILWTIFGGVATIYGPVVGVFILYPFMEILSLFPHGDEIKFILFSVILILALLFMPEGVSVWILDKIEVKCPRCKLVNYFTKTKCRACRAELHLLK